MYFSERHDASQWKKVAEHAEMELRLIKGKIKNVDTYCQNKYNEVNEYSAKKTEELSQFEKSLIEQRNLVEQFINNKISDFPLVAQVIADYKIAKDEQIAWDLEHKKRPASKTSEEIRKIKQEKRDLIAQNKSYKWELSYLKDLLPWLDEIEDEPMESKLECTNPDYESDDAAGFWLTPDEYNKLTSAEKYQIALDRYNRRKKSKQEIGREYERYIGYLYWLNGYDVQYYGIEKGKEDLGRDLICSNGDEIHIVQCKCWSNIAKKEIHEKHINQLFGTSMKYYLDFIDDPKRKEKFDFWTKRSIFSKESGIIPVFISTVPYSETALQFANALGVECRHVPLKEYPMIKCNINRRTGEKIYHLPFDQQYDNCVIDRGGKEFYAYTVKEAEEAGFRRAKRWRGSCVENTKIS